MTPHVEIVAFGAAARAAGLIAEYDAADDAIRVDAFAVERVRVALGGAYAERFVACAVAHERYHRTHPGTPEAEAHAAGFAASGIDPRRFEAILRESRA